MPSIKFQLDETSDISKLFKSNIKELWLEIGFGSGEHLKWQLENNKDIAIIGCEPYVNGIANLIDLLSEEELKRIKIYNGDARKVIENMEDHCISKVFILFPDPWPKKKHYKRRLIQTNLLESIYRILKQNGELRLSTDNSDYLTWILHKFFIFKKFQWTAKSRSDFLLKPEKWTKTKYEIRANKIENTCYFLQYKKGKKNN